METKTLKISDILIDKETYPRTHVDWITMARYINAMKAGAEFPPITVGVYKGKAYLIDGAHRLEASKKLGRTTIEAELIRVKDKKGIYIEAVKRNTKHGRAFSAQEMSGIIVKLRGLKMKPVEISKMVGIPQKQLVPFVNKRMTRIIGTNEIQPLKKSLRHLAGTQQSEGFDIDQNSLVGAAQVNLLDNFIVLLENKDWLDVENKTVKGKLKKIYKYLSTMPLS